MVPTHPSRRPSLWESRPKRRRIPILTALVTVALMLPAVPAMAFHPVAVDDVYGTAEDTPLVVAAPGVLTNDIPGSGPLTVTAFDPVSTGLGTVAVAEDGSFTYTPAANFNGSDTFNYTVSDGTATDAGMVTITVSAVNDAPVAVDDTYGTAEDTQLVVVAADGVLDNDTDVDDDTLTAVFNTDSAEGGTVTASADGSFTYTPPANFNGTDTFWYTVSDGSLDDVDDGMVTINVSAVPEPGGGGGGGEVTPPPPAGLVDTSAACPESIATSGFGDVVGFDATTIQAIDCIAQYGISNGTSDVTFTPSGTVPRWQMALFLIRQLQVHGVALPAAIDHGFTDVGAFDQETRDAINQLAQLGITQGTGNGTFSPSDPVSRWEMALFLIRFVSAVGVALPDPPASAGFTDLASLNAQTVVAIDQLVQLGLALGTSTTTFDPLSDVLRWQMALFLTRVLAVDGIVPS